MRVAPSTPNPPPTVDIRINSLSELTPSTPPPVLKLALQVPAKLFDAVDAWCEHFRGIGVPDAWLVG